MEDSHGAPLPVSATDLVRALEPYRAHFTFLSACLSAATSRAKDGASPDAGDSGRNQLVAHSLATSMVSAGFPTVLGWGGSVADSAATRFAQELYERLARSMSTPEAVASARDCLVNAPDDVVAGVGDKDTPDDLARRLAGGPLLRRDWHLPRLWVGPHGGGPVVKQGARRKRSMLPPDHAQKKLLAVKEGERLEVADPAEFVGRRRELQTALSILGGGEHAGLLIHGMGRLGKSSLAARISNRLPDFALAVVFKHYDARSILEALQEALSANEAAQGILRRAIEEVRDHPNTFEEHLIRLLAGPCKDAADGRPVLLLIDDLERVLEDDPAGGRHRVRADVREALAAVLRAFDPARSDSRLLVTSRFPFTLSRHDVELADKLTSIQLGAFHEAAREKLSLRQVQEARGRLPGDQLNDRVKLLAHAQLCARGNPGLQDLLGLKIALNPEVPAKVTQRLLEQVETFLNRGDLPPDERVRGFLENLAVDSLIQLAGDDNRRLLRAATVFELPVPAGAFAGLSDKFGGRLPRLQDLGLVEPYDDPVGPNQTAWAVNRFAAGRLPQLSKKEQSRAAASAVNAVFADWGGAAGRMRRPFTADLELVRLALLAGNGKVVQACGADAAFGLERRGQPKAAAGLAVACIELLEELGLMVPIELRARAATNLATSGDGGVADEHFAKGAAALEQPEHAAHAGGLDVFLFELGKRQHRAGKLEDALATFQRFAVVVGDRPREAAIAKGQIADILQARGQLDEALRIRREEQLPVYERLGDVRSIAVAKGKIADILQARGQLDEALRSWQEEVIPALERLGDVRSIAVAKGKIADILEARGQLDEALRIRREEELPVYERLGDVQLIAVTKGQIADILQARGQLDEALRSWQEEVIPALERLGDVRSIAAAKGKIANILLAQGDTAKARRLHEERLETNRALQDADGIASTLWALAQLDLQDEHYEAAAPRVALAYAIVEHMERAQGIAAIGPVFAQFLAAGGHTSKAIEVLQRSRAAAELLGMNDLLSHIDELAKLIQPRRKDPDSGDDQASPAPTQ